MDDECIEHLFDRFDTFKLTFQYCYVRVEITRVNRHSPFEVLLSCGGGIENFSNLADLLEYLGGECQVYG